MNFSISPIVFSICGSVFILVCVLLMQALLHLTIYDLKVLHKQDKLNITRLKNQFYYRIILFLGVLFVISLCFSLLIYVLFPLGLAVQILYLSGKVYLYEKTKGFEFMQFDKTHEQIMFYLIFQLLVSTLMVYFFFDPS